MKREHETNDFEMHVDHGQLLLRKAHSLALPILEGPPTPHSDHSRPEIGRRTPPRPEPRRVHPIPPRFHASPLARLNNR